MKRMRVYDVVYDAVCDFWAAPKGDAWRMNNRCLLTLLLWLGAGLGLAGMSWSEPPGLPASATPQLVIPKLVVSDPIPQRDVLSLSEIRRYRAALAPRLIADHMDFPLMVRPSDPVIQDRLGAPACAYFGEGFRVRMIRPWCARDAWPVFDVLKAELGRQELDKSDKSSAIEIELVAFLVNYEALCELVRLGTRATEEGRWFMLDRLAELRDVGTSLLRFKQASLNGLKRLDEIDQVALPGETRPATGGFEPLVAACEGMKEEDRRALLDILDPDEFRQLSLQRTAELLGKDVTEEEARRRLSQMAPSEAITAAAYFARSRFQAYADPEMQMETLALAGDEPDSIGAWLQVGDCKHFAGLTVHYLNNVVKPLNPRLAHWYFGLQVTHVRNYHHAYVKAVHIGPDGKSLDLFFFDPTVLANYPLRRLKPDKVRQLIEATERNDHYFVLKRYAEDLVRSPLDPDIAFGDLVIDIGGDDGRIDLLPLLRQ